jgi:hypothetical protein
MFSSRLRISVRLCNEVKNDNMEKYRADDKREERRLAGCRQKGGEGCVLMPCSRSGGVCNDELQRQVSADEDSPA